MTPLIESLRALKLGTSSVRAAILKGHLGAFTQTDRACVMLCARASTREGGTAAAAARRCRRAAERDPGVMAGAATALPPPPPPKAIASARAPTRRTGLRVSAMATPSATMARPHPRTATARATASPPAQVSAVARRTPTQRRLHLQAGARTVPNPRRPPQRRHPAHRPCRPGFASWRGRFNRLCRAPPHRHRRPPPSRGFQ